MIKSLFVIILGISLSTNLALSEEFPGPHPPYADIVKELRTTADKYPEYTDYYTYGKSFQGRDLVAIRIHKKGVETKSWAPTILIQATAHGNEYTGVADYLSLWFPSEGVKNKSIMEFLDNDGAIIILPVLNPDGYEMKARDNANGIDINRDYAFDHEDKKNPNPFTEIETFRAFTFVQQMIKNRKLLLAFDYHRWPGKRNLLIRPWLDYNSPLTEKYDLVNSLLPFEARYGTCYQLLGYEFPGTAHLFYHNNFHTVAFSLEGRVDEHLHFDDHPILFTRLIEAINKGLF